MGRLDYLAENMKWEDALPLLLKNQKQSQTNFDGLGPQILKNEQIDTQQDITSTSFVKVNGFQHSVQCSGGLIIWEGLISIKQTGNIQSNWKLLVDGKQAWLKLKIANGADIIDPLYLGYRANLPKGSHTFSLQAKVNGGTLNVTPLEGSDQTTSELYIREDLKGS